MATWSALPQRDQPSDGRGRAASADASTLRAPSRPPGAGPAGRRYNATMCPVSAHPTTEDDSPWFRRCVWSLGFCLIVDVGVIAVVGCLRPSPYLDAAVFAAPLLNRRRLSAEAWVVLTWGLHLGTAVLFVYQLVAPWSDGLQPLTWAFGYATQAAWFAGAGCWLAGVARIGERGRPQE